MVLIDASAWVEFLRDTKSPTCNLVREMLAHEIAICDVVQMEVLAGARDESNLRDLRSMLGRAVMIEVRPTDYDDAAALFRRCRMHGETVRKLMDCIIAAVAIRSGVPVLHNDRDFSVLARHTKLQVYEV